MSFHINEVQKYIYIFENGLISKKKKKKKKKIKQK